jgi:hypothetical protein
MLYACVLVVGQSGVLLVTLQDFNFRSALVNLPNEAAPRLSGCEEAGKAGLLE